MAALLPDAGPSSSQLSSRPLGNGRTRSNRYKKVPVLQALAEQVEPPTRVLQDLA